MLVLRMLPEQGSVWNPQTIAEQIAAAIRSGRRDGESQARRSRYLVARSAYFQAKDQLRETTAAARLAVAAQHSAETQLEQSAIMYSQAAMAFLDARFGASGWSGNPSAEADKLLLAEVA